MHSPMQLDATKIVTGIVILIIPVTLAVQRLGNPEAADKVAKATAEEKENDVPCEGLPIRVDYTYPHPTDADFDNPWECQVACQTDNYVPRYILYTNGNATQCGGPPNCYDTGEDQRFQCDPPEDTGETMEVEESGAVPEEQEATS